MGRNIRQEQDRNKAAKGAGSAQDKRSKRPGQDRPRVWKT